MTALELICVLSALPEDTQVWMSLDPEGLNIRPLEGTMDLDDDCDQDTPPAIILIPA